MSQEDIAKTLEILNEQLLELSSDDQNFEGKYIHLIDNLLHQADIKARLLLPPGKRCPHCGGSGVMINE